MAEQIAISPDVRETARQRLLDLGHRGFASLDAPFARYADALGDTPQARDAIRKGGSKIRYLDYDWALNATRSRH